MSDIIDFLHFRIQEEASRAKLTARATPQEGDWWTFTERIYEQLGPDQDLARGLRHADKHSPQRVLAHCEARMVLLNHFNRIDWDHEPAGDRDYMEKFLFILAQPYKDHPDFQEHWLD